MKITWLGQAGLLMEHENTKIIVDPYLSNSCEKLNPNSFRRVAVDESFLKIRPDVLLLTHNHLDHTDPETLPHYLEKFSGVTVLAPFSAWNEVRKYGNGNNYVMFNRHTTWTEKGLTFSAVKAEHSDRDAIGIIVDDGTKKYYITGDTLYNEDIFADIPNDIYALFIPINGVGNNLNIKDAANFAKRVGAQKTVPLHFGMFDEIDPHNFECENRVIPEIYKEIKI